MSSNGELRGLLSKMKFTSKFSNLNISSNNERDGNSADDTLIHNAFVKYFSTKGEPFPQWLGVKEVANNSYKPTYQQQSQQNNYANSQYQPVYTSRNTPVQQQQYQSSQQNGQQNASPEPQQPSYTPRSSSRLQDMYNKSRQQSVPGSGYSTQPAQPAFGRTNSSTTGSRLRAHMYSQNSYNASSSQSGSSRPSSGSGASGAPSSSALGSSSSRATWGRG